MPRKPRKPCAHRGCPELTEKRYCEKHTQASERLSKVELRELRDSDSFYHTSRWRNLRNWYIRRNPLCVQCQQPAKVIDHIKPIKQGGAETDLENLQSLCESCHNRKRRTERLN